MNEEFYALMATAALLGFFAGVWFEREVYAKRKAESQVTSNESAANKPPPSPTDS